MVSLGTLAALLVNAGKSNTSAADGSLTVTESSTDLTIELADDPVFAVLPVELTVEEATVAGYTLTAYTDNTDLVSTTDGSKVIPMVAADEGELIALAEDTYGLSLEEPASKDEEVYTTLSTDQDNPTIIKSMAEYSPTEAEDKTTIYYGFYITPDIPYGTYTNDSEVHYDATINTTLVTFDGNDLYFDGDEGKTTNEVEYIAVAQEESEDTINQITSGEYKKPSQALPYNFLGWSEEQEATTPTYTSAEDIAQNLPILPNQPIILYAIWQKATTITFDRNGGTGTMATQTIIAGESDNLYENTFTREGYTFTGWNTVAEPTEQEPGKAYADQADFTAPTESADITLYAQWAYYTTITFNGNGADSGSMSPQTIVAGTPEALTQNAFTKTNATFIGWNTQANGSGTSYTDEAEFTASTEEHQDITLYAQWAYTTISFSGNTSDSGTMNSITIAGGTTSNLPANTFTKNNCIFTGWNTTASGTGTSYGNSSPYTASATAKEEFTLYAQWQCISQVNYYGNGATSGQMSSSVVLGGSTLTLLQNAYTKDGYVFSGWNTQADGTGTSYPDQGTFTAPMTPATTLNLYAQWLPTTTITFNGNGADSGSMSDQTIVAGTPQNLTPNAFAKEGYIFASWNTNEDGSGTSYADQAEYTASTTRPENITLYAQWKQVFYMQDEVTWGSTLSQGDTMEAVDSRDGKSYWVSKLADGNIWMTQNLDLDIEAGRTYTSADTDLANSTIGTSWTPTVSTSTTSSWTSSNTDPSSYDPGNLYWNGNVDTSYTGNLSNRTTTDPSATSGGTHYHVGNYYNWTAAVAMSDSSSYTTDLQDVNQSICPAGWRLPTYEGDKSLLNLKNAQGFTSGTSGNIQDSPTYFVYGGYLNGGSSFVGSNGCYWSSVVKSRSYSYRLSFNAGGGLGPQSDDSRGFGYSLRCVAR